MKKLKQGIIKIKSFVINKDFDIKKKETGYTWVSKKIASWKDYWKKEL